MFMDINKITDLGIREAFYSFFMNREINRDFYSLVPEKDLDFRMVDNPLRKSDSPRESMAHHIGVTRDYIQGIKVGNIAFGNKYDDLVDYEKLSKEELIKKLDETVTELFNMLCDPGISRRKIKVPWNEDGISVLEVLRALDSHEVLHTGWNLAIMDHLNIERFPKLKAMWG